MRVREPVDAQPAAVSRRAGTRLGAIAGAIGLGCCIYPIVLVLLGLSSASSAVALGYRLYGTWGWAFRLAGAGFGLAALVVHRRRAKRCAVDRRPSTTRTAAWLVGTGVSTYVFLYVATTALANLSAG